MKYFRSQNLNPGNILDNTISVLSNGDVEINPTNKVTINGDLLVLNGNVPGPEVTNVMYVTLDGNDNNDGLGEGPDQAKRTLKAACEAAQEGATIFIRSGEYYEDNPIRVPPKVSIIGDNLRRVIVRPLNEPLEFSIINITRSNGYVTITTATAHGLNARDRIKVKCSNNTIDQTDVNLTSVTTNTMTYRLPGTDIAPSAASGSVLHGIDLFYVNSQSYMAGMVFKGLRAPSYCINIDSDAIVDTSPYVQNCSNINGPWMRNGQEWLPFITEQPDLNGTMVTGPRPLRDDEIQVGQDSIYGIDIEGAGGGMLIDGDRYSTESPIKSMVADAFTQVSQGGVGFHITNFGYMQLVSCFAVFCSKAFYTTRGGYLSISNSVIDFGTEGFVADGYYLDPYAEGQVINNYYSSVGSFTVVTEGAGYDGSSPIVVTIDPPAGVGGTQATATANYDPITGKVNAISVDDSGSGYDAVPNVVITGGGATIDATAIVNLNKNSTISVSYLPSKPQVGSIMFLGSDPVAYYVSNTVGTITPFSYNETKCRRDTGYIIDGVYYDAALGTNYNAVINGRSYRRAMASEVIDSQLTQTVGAINYLKTLIATELASNATALSRSNSAITEVVDIIENGVAAADALTFPNPVGANTNLINSKEQLIANRTFIMAEITAWIADQVAGSIAPFTGSFTYDAATCERDVGYIVDALCYDMIYGGNSATKIAAQAYFENSVSVLPASQVSQTAAAFIRLQSVVEDIIQEIAVTPSSTNVEIQDVSGSPATPTEGIIIADLVQIIIDVITAGNTSGMPATVNPSIAWADAGIQSAVATLAANKSTVIDNTIFYIDEEYASVFTYDQQKCKRDVGIILNAVLTDMIFSSNYQSTAAGVAYLRSYSSKVTSLQKSQTIAGLEEARDQTLALTVNPTAITAITTNFNTVIDIINNGLSSIPTLALPPPTLVRGGFAEASAILDANRTFIQDEITAWIALNYPVLASTYNSAKCRRDISYIIDAMRYDMVYEGNTQTTNAALAYVEGSVIFGQVEETQDAYEYWKTIIGAILSNTAVDRTIGNTTTQNVLLPIGSPIASPNGPTDVAEALLQIIIDEIDHGPGYIPDPLSYPAYTKGDSTLNAVRTTILASTTDIQDSVISFLNVTYGGSITVSVFPAITTVAAGTEVRFHNVSTISTGGTALEYVGAGVTYNALPFFGGEPIPANERIEINNGKCFTVTNDQVGNYRVGQFFTVNALTGAVTIDAENLNLSGLAAIGPFKRNGIPVGVQLREVSDNNNLIASTGTQDGNTTPTQRAVATYVENRYLNKVGSTAQTVVSDIQFNNDVTIDQDLNVDGGDITTTSGSFNLLNTNASTINFAGAATTLNIGSTTGTTTVNNDLDVAGEVTATGTQHTLTGLVDIVGSGAEEYTVKIKGSTTGAYFGVGTKSDPAYGIVNHVLNFDTSGYSKYSLTASDIHLNIQDSAGSVVQTDAIVVSTTGYVSIGSNIVSSNSTTGALVVTGGVGIGGTLNVSGNQNVGGNLDVAGTIMSTTQSTFDLLNTNVTNLNFAKEATAISIGDTTGTTTINNDLAVLGNVTLGDAVSDIVTINGQLDIVLPDNTTSAFELFEGLNSYLKIDTINGVEKVTFGVNPQIVISNVTDSSTSTSGSLTVAGGVGIAKKLYVGTDLTVTNNTVFGDERTTDTHAFTGTVDILVPDNGASPFKIRENLSEFLTVVTTDGSESVSIGTVPKLKVLNTTDSTTKDTGALIVEGGVGIELNLTVGVDLQVDRNTVLTGDLAVNGGDLTTTAATFNLINGSATTVNFAGAATAIAIGDTTGTTTVKHNLDVDGDVNIDGSDLTVGTTSFNLANTTAVSINFAGAATTLTVGATTGTTTIRNNLEVDLDATINGNLDVDGDVNIDGGDLTASTSTFNLLNTTVATGNVFGAATAINIGTTAATLGTLTVGPAITGNEFKLQSIASGTINYTTDVTSGTVNAWQSVTGTINIGSSGTINLGTSALVATTAVVGGALTGNTLKIASTTGGTANLSSDVTTGIVNVFTGVSTGTVNIATGGTNTINVGSSTSIVNIGDLRLTTDLEVQYGGTGVSTFTANGVIYGNTTGALQVTAASDPGVSNATTSYGILTTDASNVPVWTDTIDGGSY